MHNEARRWVACTARRPPTGGLPSGSARHRTARPRRRPHESRFQRASTTSGFAPAPAACAASSCSASPSRNRPSPSTRARAPCGATASRARALWRCAWGATRPSWPSRSSKRTGRCPRRPRAPSWPCSPCARTGTGPAGCSARACGRWRRRGAPGTRRRDTYMLFPYGRPLYICKPGCACRYVPARGHDPERELVAGSRVEALPLHLTVGLCSVYEETVRARVHPRACQSRCQPAARPPRAQ